MYNLMGADLFKLRKSAAIKILFGITALCAVAMTIMAYLIPQGKIDKSLTGVGFLFSDINVMGILGAVIAGVFICGDFDNKTIHDAIANGSGRLAVIVSKAAVFCAALAFILLPYAVVTGVALGTGYKFGMGSMAVGFLHLMVTEAGKAFSAPEIGKLVAIMLTLIIVYASQMSICVPLAFGMKKPVLVVAINYGLQILCGQLSAISANIPAFERVFACTPFGCIYKITSLDASAGDILSAIAVSLIFFVAMIAITYAVFRKSEIK
ncbi:MAG: ABC transporter permease [Clostridia bacterium]|nr:ABC transporter permease [Clostridia bacterium]